MRCFLLTFELGLLQIHRPQMQPLFIIEKWRVVQESCCNCSSVFRLSVVWYGINRKFSLSHTQHFWISAWFPLLYSIWISLNIASHPLTSPHIVITKRDTQQMRQTVNQPLNQICNLTLSTTHYWILFNFDLFQSGLESNCIRIQISMALCSSGPGSSITQSVFLAPSDSVCSQSSDGNHTKLDQYWIQQGELCLITTQYWKVRVLITYNMIIVMHRDER